MSDTTVEDNALVETKQPKLLVRRSKLDKLDLAEVTEVYSKGVTHTLAAKVLGVSVAYWSAIRHGKVSVKGVEYSDLLDAIEKGQAVIGLEVMNNLRKMSKKQAIPAIFLGTQSHIGDLENPRNHKVEHGGTLTIKFEESVGLPDPIVINPDSESE